MLWHNIDKYVWSFEFNVKAIGNFCQIFAWVKNCPIFFDEFWPFQNYKLNYRCIPKPLVTGSLLGLIVQRLKNMKNFMVWMHTRLHNFLEGFVFICHIWQVIFSGFRHIYSRAVTTIIFSIWAIIKKKKLILLMTKFLVSLSIYVTWSRFVLFFMSKKGQGGVSSNI